MLKIRANDSTNPTDHKYCVERSDTSNARLCIAGFSTFNDALAAIYLVQKIARQNLTAVDAMETR
jgi:hypothetical protein